MAIIMKRLYLCIITIFLSTTCLDARIMSDKQILGFIKGMEQYNTYPNLSIRKDKRTIIVEAYDADPEIATKATPAQIASYHTDDIAAIFSSNFISQKNIYHYTNQYGVPAIRVVEASPFDFLGISDNKYRVSLKNNPRSLGVNIEIVEPRGWEMREPHNPYILVNYMTGKGEDQLSYMIEIVELPIFLSRRESTKIFHGLEVYGVSLEGLLGNMTDNIIDIKDDLIGAYPAIHIRLLSDIIIAGEPRKIYTNCWFIIYEDRVIKLWGTAIRPTDYEKGLYDMMFQMLASQVRFPDQFEKKYE